MVPGARGLQWASAPPAGLIEESRSVARGGQEEARCDGGSLAQPANRPGGHAGGELPADPPGQRRTDVCTFGGKAVGAAHGPGHLRLRASLGKTPMPEVARAASLAGHVMSHDRGGLIEQDASGPPLLEADAELGLLASQRQAAVAAEAVAKAARLDQEAPP